MAIVKRAISPVGMFVANQVKPFLVANSAAMAATETKIDVSAKSLADAIAYGVCKSFSHPAIAAAITSAMVLPVGGPLVPPPHVLIKAQSMEV
jgi:hypothetical protein